ncbi:MAG: hypothetical protein ACYTGZ_15015 [Planctomycetota bacterium]|jgi:fatty acid desaturase
MGRELCVRCQTPVTPGQDFCPTCGVETGVAARTLGHFYRGARFAMMGGRRRRPGEHSTFVRLRWLPAAFGVFAVVITVAAFPSRIGVGVGTVVGAVAFFAVTFYRYAVEAQEKREDATRE